MGRQSDFTGNVGEDLRIAEVSPLDKVRSIQRAMDRFTTWLAVRPLRQFLSQSAVVRMRSPFVGQPFGIHQAFHACVHNVQVETAPCKQILQNKSFLRRVRMQWEINPLHIDFKIPFQLFNTPGTEIAPRSDKICKDLQCDRFAH